MGLRRRLSSKGYEDVFNPMESIANMADVMFVLSVGLMLALVMHWNVDIGVVSSLSGSAQGVEDERNAGGDNALRIEGDNIEDISGEAEQIDSGGMEKLGTVYFDEKTGNYYIISD